MKVSTTSKTSQKTNKQTMLPKNWKRTAKGTEVILRRQEKRKEVKGLSNRGMRNG